MITLLAWILLMINLTILVISLIVVFMQKGEKPVSLISKPRITSTAFVPAYQPDSIDIENQRRRILDYIQLRCPEFKVMFEEIVSDHGCVFHFRGITKKKENILYVLRNEDAKDAFMSAVDELIAQAKTPEYGIVLSFPFYEETEEILLQLKSHNIPICMIMYDHSGLNDFLNTGEMAAFVGVGEKPYALYEVKNDNEEYDWLGELNPCALFQPIYTEQAYRSVKSLERLLPWNIRFMLHFPSLFSGSIMSYLMQHYPDTISWFYPMIDKQDTCLLIYAPSRSSLEDAMKRLEASAQKSNVTLTLKETRTRMHLLNEEDPYYEKWMQIIRSTSATLFIPQLNEEHNAPAHDCPIVSFSPLYQNKTTSSYEAVQYYLQLLELKVPL